MKLLVCGGRTFGYYDDVKIAHNPEEINKRKKQYDFGIKTLDGISINKLITTVISGMATGADSIGVKWAYKYDINLEPYFPEWKKFGKYAGIERNERMLEIGMPDIIVAFPGNTGTAHMCKIGKKANVEVIQIPYSD